jgi:hypothetical protein
MSLKPPLAQAKLARRAARRRTVKDTTPALKSTGEATKTITANSIFLTLQEFQRG